MSAAVTEQLETAANWCLRLAEGPLTPSEQEMFDAWTGASPGNLAAFERSVGMWRQLGDVSAAPEFIDLRERALTAYRRENRRRWVGRTISARTIAAIAAALLVMIGAGWWWQMQPDVYRTGLGERRVVMLDDGSRASLDGATEVDVRMRGDRRALQLLYGRAKFDVARDPLKPFSVRAGNKLVVATGTSFSVELANGKLRVVLYEGKVAVLDVPPDGGEPVAAGLTERTVERALVPGRELVAGMEGGPARIVAADPSRSLAWEAGQLVFDDEPLSLAVSRINRHAARPVKLMGTAGRLRVNGVFNTGDVDAFATGVEETLPVHVIRNADGVTITPR